MLGRLDGENAVKDGEGFMFNRMREWRDSPELQAQYPRVNDYVTYTVRQRAAQHRRERRQQEPKEIDDEAAENVRAEDNFI